MNILEKFVSNLRPETMTLSINTTVNVEGYIGSLKNEISMESTLECFSFEMFDFLKLKKT